VDGLLLEIRRAPTPGAAQDATDLAASVLAASPAGRGALGRVLLQRAERSVRSAWEGGWQPADLARMVAEGRGNRDPHLRLAADAIAAEGRRYPAAALPPRWSAQLAELDAESTRWDGDDDSYLDHVVSREKLDGFRVVGAVLELIALLDVLPRITPIGPIPGASQREPGARTGLRAAPKSGTEPRMLGRIRALLAKAESTEFPGEAEALTAKAQQLMAQHSISEALLAAESGSGAEQPGGCRIGVDSPYESAKALLLDGVAEANRCRTVWSKDLGFSAVVGFESDLSAVELLYTSLLVQATTAMNAAGGRKDHRGRSRTRAFRQSFLVAYAERIRERLAAATEAAVDAVSGRSAGGGAQASQASDDRLLPVLAARDVAVREATETLYPEVVRHSVRRGRDWEGWEHGTAAADRASLDGGGAEPRLGTGR
jgi:hypothetical protein